VAAGVVAAAVALGVNHSGTRATAKPVAAARSGFGAIQTSPLSVPSASSQATPTPAAATTPTTRAQTKATAASTAALAASLDAALAGTNSCLVVSDGTTPIYVHQPSAPLIPASTQKLLGRC
jgi:D-alanyl-D-alanine carboxypeptidase